MRLKSLAVTNQRIKRTCVANIFMMLCLLTSHVWSFANMKHSRFARQLNDEMAVNYEDFSTTNPYHQPHFTGNRSVVVQLFEWKFVDIAAECRDFLGPQGYAGVQLSPVLEHTVVKTDDLNHPWWERFEVVSYRLASRSGDETEFWSMSRICNEHGVRIYADVVLNHMAAPLNYLGVTEDEDEEEGFIVNTLLETNVDLSQLNYSYVSYTHNDFHKPACMIMANTQDAHVIRNCRLNGHPDLDHSRGNVQKQIVKMLNKFVDMGVAGFRIDTAKYMWPIDLKNIFKQVKNLSTAFNFKKNSRPFVYFDVFDLGLDAVSKTEYLTYGMVSEYLYAAELSTILRGKIPLSSLINWGPALGFLPPEDALVFIDSHDTQRGMPWDLGRNQMLTYKQRIPYIMANVFMLVHPYGAIKRIMSSYYFENSDINQGPPVEEADEEAIRSPQYDGRKQCSRESGWVCEHRWPQMVNLIKVTNYFRAVGNKEESIIYFQTNGPNQIAFCRGQKAFVAINNDVENDFIKEVYACLEPGVYCDMVTGGKKDGLEECHGKILEINEQGYIKLELNVADNKRSNNEEGMEIERLDEEEEEEDSGEIQSYGIVVIYVESRIQPSAKTEAEDTKAGAQEENSKEQEESENKTSTEDEQDVQIEENDAGLEQESGETEGNKEPIEGQEDEEAEGQGESKEKSEESVVQEEAAETKSENEKNEEDSVRNEENKEEQEIENGATSLEINEPDGTQKDALSSQIENEATPFETNEPDENQEDALNSEENKEKGEIEDGSQSSEANPPDENQDSNELKDMGEEQGGDKNELSKENENEAQNDKEGKDINAEDENEANEDDLHKKEEEEQESLDDSTKGPSAEEADKNLDEQPTASTNAGNNQSRNLDDKITDGTEEQIEKPSAEIVEEAGGDISDVVTAKIQDVQKAGIISNGQGKEIHG